MTGELTISEEILFNGCGRADLPVPSPDPLYEVDALAEAVLLDVRLVPVVSAAALLFDTRTALALGVGNTAVLVVHGVTRLSAVLHASPPVGVTVVAGSETRQEAHAVSVSLTDIDGGRIEIEGGGASVTVGAVEGIGPCAAPIEGDDLTLFAASVPDWGSPMRALAHSTRGHAP